MQGLPSQLAVLCIGTHGLRIVPDSRQEGFKTRPQRLPKSPGHQKEWIEACKAGKPAGSDFSYGGPLTGIALLGVIAMRFKGRICAKAFAGLANLSDWIGFC